MILFRVISPILRLLDRIDTATRWEPVLDNRPEITYNSGIGKDRKAYMIQQTLERMERIEEILAQARSDWAKQYWAQVLKYFQRRLRDMDMQ